MLQPELNKTFSELDIVNFVLDNDRAGLFKSAAANKIEFTIAIRKMNDAGQIIVFRDGYVLRGVLGWCFTDDSRKHELSKQIWRLPTDIITGDILYLSFVTTNGNCNLVGIKKLFETWGYRKRITRRRGFTRNGWYEHFIFRQDIHEH